MKRWILGFGIAAAALAVLTVLTLGSSVHADPMDCGVLTPWYVEVTWEGDGSPGLFAVCTEAEAKSAAADINLKGWRTDESHLIASGALRGLYVFESATETRSYRAGGSGGGF